MKTKILKKDIAALLKLYGTHAKVAQELGITYRHWCNIKTGKQLLNSRTRDLIDMRLGRCNCPKVRPGNTSENRAILWAIIRSYVRTYCADPDEPGLLDFHSSARESIAEEIEKFVFGGE